MTIYKTLKYGPLTAEKKKKMTQATAEEAQTLNLLDKTYKIHVLDMLREMNETI